MTIDEAIEFYETADHEFKQFVGGYCDSVCYLDGVVAIANDTSGEPDLEMLSAKVFIAWMQSAKKELEGRMHGSSMAAIWETKLDDNDC